MLAADVVIPGTGRPYLDGDSLDLSAPLVFTIPGVLSLEECAHMIAKIEELGPTDAPITTAAGFVMNKDVRNNTRVMFDDVPLAARIYERIGPALPDVCHTAPCGANERFRCYRYAPGQRFAPHYDGCFRRNPHEVSELTLMVYLNEDFVGGTTRFHDFDIDVRPRTGMALLFQHRVLHEGCEVERGVKYVLRSDVMYGAGT
jgi:predicted 2-oxoglutarate/Fe(II)-dependent dioxygenase YbiX